jgi:hypothetical protein
MLAEFVYGLKPKESFAELFGIDQIVPRKAFYHLKKVISTTLHISYLANNCSRTFSLGYTGVAW